MIKINKKNVVLFLAFLMSIFMFSCKSSSSSGSVDTIASLTTQGGEWILKIDDLTMYEDKFNKEFELALLMRGAPAEQIALAKNDATVKQQYLDDLIGQILLLQNAQADGFFETEDAQDYLQVAYRAAQFQYYTQQLMEEAVNEMPEPTQQQIAAFYEQYASVLAQQYRITEISAQTIPYISQIIKNQQAQQKIMITVSDLKDKARIDRNKDIIGDIVPTIQSDAAGMGGLSTGDEEGVLR